MFRMNPTKNLKEGEVIVLDVRRSVLSFLGSIVLAGFLILAPFFFLFPLLRLGQWGVGMFFAALLLALILILRLVLLLRSSAFLVTNQRLLDIDQRGLFEQVVSEADYRSIGDVSFSIKGISQTLFRYGTVRVQTSAGKVQLAAVNVREPARLHNLILGLRAAAHTENAQGQLTADELVGLLRRLKEGLGEDRLKALLESDEHRVPRRGQR